VTDPRGLPRPEQKLARWARAGHNHLLVSRRFTRIRWLTGLALTAGCLSPALLGCPGTLDDPARFQVPRCDPAVMVCGSTTSTQPTVVTTAQIQTQVFSGKCVSCHGGTAPLGELDLTGMPLVLEGRIVETLSDTALCRGSRFVVPGQPDRSLMYVKMTDTPTCGGSMPLGVSVNAADAALVRQWIIDLGAQ
jgi:hypothetical protein